MPTVKRSEALQLAYEAGRMAAMPATRRASRLDCSEADVSDVFENHCMGVEAVCNAAGVSQRESTDAYDRGWKDEKAKVK